MKHLHRIKKFEERLEKVIEDPAKIIQIINKILNLACYELDETFDLESYTKQSTRRRKINPPVPEEKKVTFWEFVKYYGNNQFERALEHGWDLEEHKKHIKWMENSIREIDGFSNYDLPEGEVLKYR